MIQFVQVGAYAFDLFQITSTHKGTPMLLRGDGESRACRPVPTFFVSLQNGTQCLWEDDEAKKAEQVVGIYFDYLRDMRITRMLSRLESAQAIP